MADYSGAYEGMRDDNDYGERPMRPAINSLRNKGPQEDDDRSTPTITGLLSYIREQMEMLQKSLGDLEAKIEPVLLPGFEEGTKSGFAPDVARQSDVANELEGLQSTIQRAIGRVNDMSNRVQI